jgi:hypothetical protein
MAVLQKLWEGGDGRDGTFLAQLRPPLQTAAFLSTLITRGVGVLGVTAAVGWAIGSFILFLFATQPEGVVFSRVFDENHSDACSVMTSNN